MAAKVKVGKPLPDMKVKATGDHAFSLAELKGRNVVLYFYPKDNTPGCTTEGMEFGDRHADFRRLKTVVFGVSRDSLASHEKFKAKHRFPFDLISDEDEKLCRAFDVIREKKLYGRSYRGVDRSTFLFDQKGVLRKEFRGVKVKGHVKEVLDALKAI